MMKLEQRRRQVVGKIYCNYCCYGNRTGEYDSSNGGEEDDQLSGEEETTGRKICRVDSEEWSRDI